jgi:Fic-DOC domain mobile mystery protein B
MLFGKPIPGETPIDDVSGLKIKGITTRAELNEFEADNIRRAAAKYLAGKPTRRSAKFDYPWCLKLHREMFGKVWSWAGQARSCELNIGIPFAAIPETLAMLLDNAKSWPGFQRDWTEQAAELHHQAVRIHPFMNGNGRWSRMLANIWLKLNGQPTTSWPETVIGGKSVIRSRYIAAIKSADDGDYGELIKLHREFVERAS